MRRGLESRHRRGIRRVGIADRHRHAADRVIDGIEPRQVIRTDFGGAVKFAVGVQRGITPVGRDLVVQICLRIGPVPLRDDDVPLEALRTRRRCRNFAGGNPIGPVGEHRERTATEAVIDAVQHAGAGLPGLHAAFPLGGRGRKRVEQRRNFARPFAAHLMARLAAVGLHQAKPLGLTLQIRADAVAARTRAGKLALVGHLDERVPVLRRIVLRRGARIRRDDSGQIQRGSRTAGDFR